mgnify:CR=1 FL=1
MYVYIVFTQSNSWHFGGVTREWWGLKSADMRSKLNYSGLVWVNIFITVNSLSWSWLAHEYWRLTPLFVHQANPYTHEHAFLSHIYWRLKLTALCMFQSRRWSFFSSFETNLKWSCLLNAPAVPVSPAFHIKCATWWFLWAEFLCCYFWNSVGDFVS